MPVSQIFQNDMYIENIQRVGINEIIADMKPVHATYRIFSVYVKP
jgi:hypothetical protein